MLVAVRNIGMRGDYSRITLVIFEAIQAMLIKLISLFGEAGRYGVPKDG